MKAFRGTALLSIFVVMVAGYTAWEYKKAAQDAGTNTEQEKRLFTIKHEDVQKIKLTRPTETILIQQEAGFWKIKSPVEDTADASSVDALLYSLLNQKGKIFRSEEDMKAPNWAEFGLEPPGNIVEVKDKKSTETLSVSSKNAFDGSFYLRQGSDLLLGDRGLAQAVSKDANAFRLRRLWREGDTPIDSARVEINADIKDKYTLVKKTDWAMEPAPGFAVDPARIAEWVKHVQALTPSEIVGETLSDEDKKNALLPKPSMILKLHYKEGELTITAGQDKSDDVYLYTSARPTVYKAARSALDVIRVPKDYFRDGRKAFHFPVEQAREVMVHHGPFSHTFKKDDAGWKLADGSEKEFTLDQDKLIAFFQNLNALEAQEFQPASAGKGYKPDQHIVVKGDKGQTLLDLSWGDEYKAKRPFNKGMTFRFVKTNLEKEVMGLQSPKITNLMESTMVTKKAPPATAPVPKAEKK
jgi:hypothetical protein